MSDTPHRQLAAALTGDTLTLTLLRDASAQATAFDASAPLLDRVLAAAASGVMQVPVVEAMIREDPDLLNAALGLVPVPPSVPLVQLDGAQTGDVTIGGVAGRDVVTINVYLGAHPRNQ